LTFEIVVFILKEKQGVFFMREKKCLIFAILLSCSAMLFAQGGAETKKTEEPLHLVYCSIMVPGDPMGKGERLFADKVAELSGGKLIIDLYDSAQLFNQDNELPALKQGKCDMGKLGMQEFDEAKYCAMFKSAYIFSSVEHAQRFYSSPEGQAVFDDLAKNMGVRALGTAFYGTRQINLYKLPYEVKVPQDMKKVMLRMPGGPDWTALGEALGAKPTPIAFNEVYMALKTGSINGQDNGLSVSKAMSFQEVTTQVVLTDHLVWNLHIAINEKRWQSLTPDQKGWIQAAADIAHAYTTKIVQEEEAALVSEYENLGIKVTVPDKKVWIDYASNYYKNNKDVTKNWDWDLYQAVKKYAD
jgi:TRAP-type C4-dicarboxylate transport system substrate-binding protein